MRDYISSFKIIYIYILNTKKEEKETSVMIKNEFRIEKNLVLGLKS